MKVCTKCKLELPLENFSERMKRGKKTRRSSCRSCEAEYRKEYNKTRSCEQPIWRRHHMTAEDYFAMRAKQNEMCANPACTKPIQVIDHDHLCCPGKRSCGKCVMGLLCSGCNFAEGNLGGDPEKARGLAQYIIDTRK